MHVNFPHNFPPESFSFLDIMRAYTSLFWFPFSPSEWITRTSNEGLTIPGQGVLICLLCYQWLEGDIPGDLTAITKILGGFTGQDVHDVLKLFVARQTKVSRLYFPPLESAREEAILKRKKLRDAGIKGATSRYGKK